MRVQGLHLQWFFPATLNFPLTLPLSPGFGGEGGVRGYFPGIFYAMFRLISIAGALIKVKQKQSIFLIRRQGPDDFFSPLAKYLFIVTDFNQFQGFAGANFNANGVFHVGTSVTFESDLSFWPGENDSIGTEHGTSPAGDATVFTDDHEICLRIPHQSPSEAGVQARCFKAMAALQREGNLVIPFHTHTRLG
jgi:hypothetical protein